MRTKHVFGLIVPAVAAYACAASASADWADFNDPQLVLTGMINPESTEPANLFGASIAVHGDRLVVGAPSVSPDTNGAAYIYGRNSDGQWHLTAQLSPEAGTEHANFGACVDIQFETVIVGAPAAGSTGGMAGAAFIFRVQEDGTWQPDGTVTGAAGDIDFGHNVAIRDNPYVAGTYAMVASGAESVTHPGVSLIQRQGDGLWLVTDRLEAEAWFDEPGASLDFFHHHCMIGSPGWSAETGRVDIYDINLDGTATPGQSLTGSEEGEHFGSAIDFRADLALIGAAGGWACDAELSHLGWT